MQLLALFVLLVATLHGVNGVSCPSGYANWYGDRCYKRIDSLANWQQQRSACVNDGADLVSIHSASEEMGIRSMITKAYFYIGLTVGSDGNPNWSDGTSFDYNDMFQSCISCVYAITAEQGPWESEDANHNFGAICVHSDKHNEQRTTQHITPSTRRTTPTTTTTQSTTTPHTTPTTPSGSITVSPSSASECGSGYDLIDGTDICLRVETRVDTWRNAEARCVQDGAHLPSIHSKQMNDYIRRVSVSYGFIDGVFIGMKLADNQSPAWIDQTPFDYNNFEAGMPNSLFGSCGTMQTSDLMGRWTSINCDSFDRLPSLCSRPLTCPVYNSFEYQGEVYSPEYPNSVVTGLQCEYFLAVEQGQVVLLRILDISLQPGDFVYLYEGMTSKTPLAVITNESLNERFVTTLENVMKVVHVSGSSLGRRSWHAEFFGV